MICRNCEEYEEILAIQKNLINTYLDISVDFKRYAILNREHDLKCDNCGAIIHNDEYYLDEEIIEEIKDDISKEIAKKIKNEIVCCESCGHGDFMSGLKHSIYSMFDEADEEPEKMFEEINYSTDLWDLINYISDWDDNLNEGIIRYVNCPNCNSGTGANYEEKIDYGEFDKYTTVYTQKDIDKFNEAFYDERETYKYIKQEINNIANVCTYQELVELKKEYVENPLLVKSKSLQKIINLLQSLYNRNKMYVIDEFYILYRTRINKTTTVLQKKDMWEPPISVASHGRYNQVGMPVLYLSNNKEVIKQEVKKQEVKKPISEYYNIASFKIKGRLKFLKINSIFSGKFEGFINEEVPEDEEKLIFKEQYIITNIISMLIKNIGFNGVAYISTKDTRYINFAVLKYDRNKDIEIIEVLQEKC